jgi:gliding motility-associatede transport system auxiliary component
MKPPQKLMAKLHSILFYLLLLAVVGLTGWLSHHHVWVWDWSANSRNSLSQTSQTLLERLEEPLHITSFTPQSPELRRRISDVIDRYRRYRPDIRFDFVNPERQPELVRQLGIKVMGELRLEYQGRAENLSTISEDSISNAIQQLMQGETRWIGVVEGHGERRLDGRANHDLGGFGDELLRKGYKLKQINLATMINIPQNLSLLVIASPQVDYLPVEVDRLLEHIKAGGNLLWLFEPGPEHGLSRLKDNLGLHIIPGTIVDPNSASMRLPDPAMALVPRYSKHPATANFKLISVFPHAAAIEAVGETGWQAIPLLSTLAGSWNETGPIKGEISRNREQGEIAGPLTLGIAFSRKLEHGQQNIIVIGDGDFLANTYLGNGGNLNLGLNLVRWLSNDNQLLDIPARTAPDLRLDLSTTASSVIGLGFLLLLPLLFIATGTIIWLRRRRL